MTFTSPRLRTAVRFFSILALFTGVCERTSFAEGLEANVGALFRAYPLQAIITGEGAYGKIFWGTKEEGDFKYGYIRPYLRVGTIAVVNRGEIGVGFYPISIFGITAGYMQSVRLTNPPGINSLDCTTINCKGTIGTPFARANLTLGVWNLVGTFSGRLAPLLTFGATQAQTFAEEPALSGNSTGDWNASLNAFLGYKVYQKILVGLNLQWEAMLSSGQNSNLQGIAGVIPLGNYRIVAGLGAMQSTILRRSFTVYGTFTWFLTPTVMLQ